MVRNTANSAPGKRRWASALLCTQELDVSRKSVRQIYEGGLSDERDVHLGGPNWQVSRSHRSSIVCALGRVR